MFNPMADGKCGNCGSGRIERQVRLEPTWAKCKACEFQYELDGTPNGYRGTLLTKAAYEARQARMVG